MSKLADILEQEIQAEIDVVQTRARGEAEATLTRARERAAAQVAAHARRLEAAEQAAARRARSSAQLTVVLARARARDQAMAQVHRQLLSALADTAAGPRYGSILRALAGQALASLSGEGRRIVWAHPEDRVHLEAWAQQQGLDLATDPQLHWGVRVSAGESGRSVENTLEGRLQRAWETLSADVAAILWPRPTPTTEPADQGAEG